MAERVLRTYTPEELHLLAVSGRLKGRGIERLAPLHPRTRQHKPVPLPVFERLLPAIPSWTDPRALLHTFLDLVAIHSPSGREDGVAAYLTTRLRDLRFSHIVKDAFGNLIARLPATASKAPGLLFTAHMDCVYPGGDAPVVPVFHPSGDIRTSGENSLGADDKAGIAAILAALGYIQNARLPHGGIAAVFTVQEELGYRGIKQVSASALNGVHLVLSMDPPVRVERGETAQMAVLHMPQTHPFVHLIREAARDCGLKPLILFAEDGYVGGDTLCLSPLGALIADFCSTSRYAHTRHEHIRIADLIGQTNWMIAAAERALAPDPSALPLPARYRDVPIGALTGLRKPSPPSHLRENRDLARALCARPDPAQVPALIRLSAIAPHLGDPALLRDLVHAYALYLKMDHVPQVLRDLAQGLAHLSSSLADARALEPLIDTAWGVVERGGDDHARANALNFLAELFHKSRNPAVKNRLLRLFILSLHSRPQAALDFLRANLDQAVHALTAAFCTRDRAGWERLHRNGAGRIVGGRSRIPQQNAQWTAIRQRILQLLLEADRVLPEMLEWIFTHDSAATQQIAAGFIDPRKTTRIARRILHNLKSRQPGVQETAVNFAGAHRMAQAVEPLIDLLLSSYLCHNRPMVEWALNRIGPPALPAIISRLSADAEFAPFARQFFNAHDRATDAEFDQMERDLRTAYGEAFSLRDEDQQILLAHHLGNPDAGDLSRWDKRRAIVFYTHLMSHYPHHRELKHLSEYLEEVDASMRGHFLQMAMQKNIFASPDILALLTRENARFLEHLVRLEKHIPLDAVLTRLREFTLGVQLDYADPRDVDIYYLHLLRQSPQMPDRTRYLKHIREAQNNRLFPPVKPYCKAIAITGDRIEEVGTVDRERIRALTRALPGREGRAGRLREVLNAPYLAKRERQRLINNLSEAFGIDVSSGNTIEERTESILSSIDFEFDAAYRPVPQILFPHLMRVRMKHRSDAVVGPLANCAIEYALINHPEIREAFDAGETDLVLDGLNDLFTDRVYEAERELSEDAFPELLEKHRKALAQFYTGQWKAIVRDLKKQFPDGRQAHLIAATEQAMAAYDSADEEEAELLDTNLNRLIQVLAPGDSDLLAFHNRHRESFKVYAAMLRVRNLRQLKRIYREVYLSLQGELSFAGREHLPDPKRPDEHSQRNPAPPGYLKYARKELGKLAKLMADFALEQALAEPVAIVQSEIAKLRQVVVGASQILCVPCKDISVIYRSWPGNDCNTGNIAQVLCPDCTFYKIISDGQWKGYFTLVEVRRKNERALLLDVLNYSGLKMENENVIKALMHHVIQTAQTEGMRYVLTSLQDTHISNRDYIRRAFRKTFPSQGTVQHFGLFCSPTAHFQSLNPNLAIAWQAPAVEH